MSTAIAARNPAASLIVKGTDAIRSRLPAGLNVDNFMSAVIMEANKLPANVQPRSVADSAMNCAILGLTPGSALGHAYFVAYGKDNPVCQLIVGYRGFLELAYNSRFLRSVYAEVVLAGEEFRQYTTINGPQIEHEIPLERSLTKDNIVASYCVWEARNGGRGLCVVPKSELLRIPQRNVWLTEFAEMSKKTSVRRGSKTWKLSQTLAMAVSLDETADRGEPQPSYADFGCDDRVANRLPGETKSDQLANVMESRVSDKAADSQPVQGTAGVAEQAITKAADAAPNATPTPAEEPKKTPTPRKPPATKAANTEAATPPPVDHSPDYAMFRDVIDGIARGEMSLDDYNALIADNLPYAAEHNQLTPAEATELKWLAEHHWQQHANPQPKTEPAAKAAGGPKQGSLV